jgi:hypothetical protein
MVTIIRKYSSSCVLRRITNEQKSIEQVEKPLPIIIANQHVQNNHLHLAKEPQDGTEPHPQGTNLGRVFEIIIKSQFEKLVPPTVLKRVDGSVPDLLMTTETTPENDDSASKPSKDQPLTSETIPTTEEQEVTRSDGALSEGFFDFRFFLKNVGDFIKRYGFYLKNFGNTLVNFGNYIQNFGIVLQNFGNYFKKIGNALENFGNGLENGGTGINFEILLNNFKIVHENFRSFIKNFRDSKNILKELFHLKL